MTAMNAYFVPRSKRSGLVAIRGGVLGRLLLFLIVVFAFLALAWMVFLPPIVTSQLRKRTGFDGTVERLAVNPFTGSVEMSGLVVSNPPTFPIRDFLDLREFRADAHLRSLFSDHPVFNRMMVDLSRITLVKREDGKTNAEAFEDNLNASPGSNLVDRQTAQRTFLIKHLELRVDRLIIVDHSLRKPTEREFTLDLNQTYTDVTSVEQLLAPAALKSLAPVAAAIGGLIPGELGRALRQVGGLGAESFREAGRKAGERVKGFFDALEESKKP